MVDVPFRILHNEVTTQQAVALSTLVACHQSTVSFQALAAKKPVIHFIPESQSFTTVPLELGLSQKVVSPDDFPVAWEQALQATGEKDFFALIHAPRNSAKLCAETLLGLFE